MPRRSAIAMLALACSTERPPPAQPLALDVYLTGVAALPAAQRRAEVERWLLDEPAWRRIVVEPYRARYAEFARDRDAVIARLDCALAQLHAVHARAHFAGDPGLTRGQIIARWAVPPMFASEVVDAIDAVFFRDGARWRALAGLDLAVDRLLRAADPACADRFVDVSDRRCRELAWEATDAQLRTELISSPRFQHACALAAALCGKSKP